MSASASITRINLRHEGLQGEIRPLPPRFVERHPLPASRLGTLRRKPRGATCAARLAGQRRATARSLDNSKHLAISCADEAKLTETKQDKYLLKCRYQGMLLLTLERIVREIEVCVHDKHETLPVETFDEIQRVIFIVGPRLIEQAEKENRRKPSEVEIEIVAVSECLKRFVDLQPEKRLLLVQLYEVLKHLQRRKMDYTRLYNCQMEWIGFKPRCCDSPALAVPIGCNHRMCFLCNGHRAEKTRHRVRVLFDRLEHPQLLTLTIPNRKHISKGDFHRFGMHFNKFRKEHSSWIKGGMRAFEVTYNESNPETPWHIHAHVLIDGAAALPVCKCPRKYDASFGYYRRQHAFSCEFVRFKRRLEFSWLCLTQGKGDAHGRWRPSDFDYWFAQTWERTWKSNAGRAEWNLRNRRVCDIRRVTDRKKAAFEVLKYITKASAFAHNTRAVDEFITAVRGTRMLQTFGSWYGFKFEDDVNTWAHLECGCGKNEFERVGRVFREAVYMEPISGKWLLHAEILSRGSP